MGICTFCGIETSNYILSDTSNVVPICTSCNSFKNKVIKKNPELIRLAYKYEGYVGYIIRFIIYRLILYPENQVKGIISRLKPYFGKNFPWNDLINFLELYGVKRHKTENKADKTNGNELTKVLDLSKPLKHKIKGNRIVSTTKQKISIASNNIVNDKRALYRLIANINSAEDFISKSEDIFLGLPLLKASAEYMTTSPEFELFSLFHNKLKNNINEIVKINARKSVKILTKCQPLYSIVKERVFLDNMWMDYEKWYNKINSPRIVEQKSKLKNNYKDKRSIKGIDHFETLKFNANNKMYEQEMRIFDGDFEIYNHGAALAFQKKERIRLLSLLTNLFKKYRNKKISGFAVNTNENELPGYLKYFEERALMDIAVRRIGIPGGEWISTISSKVLKNAGFLFFNMKEKNGRIKAKVWTKEGLIFLQLWPLEIKNNYDRWHRLLVTYMLCALADLVSLRSKRNTNKAPALPKDPIQRKLNGNKRNSNIYRPRIKQGQESPAREDKIEPYTKRNPFFVSWHLRKIMNGNTASSEARNKAIEYASLSWEMWDAEWKGFTFVSPHVRGGNKDKHSDIKKIIVNRLAESFSLTIDNLYK